MMGKLQRAEVHGRFSLELVLAKKPGVGTGRHGMAAVPASRALPKRLPERCTADPGPGV